MKYVRLFLVCLFAIISVGCATQRENNILAGAVTGGFIGATIPTNQQSVPRSEPQCPPYSRWDGRGCLIVQQVIPQSFPSVPSHQIGSGICPAGSSWNGQGCWVPYGNNGISQGASIPPKTPGWCHSPYKYNNQGQLTYSGGFPC